MKCVYCKKNVALKVWGQHSQECENRKVIRSGAAVVEVSGPEVVDPDQVLTLDEMTKDDLILYLETNEIEHDPTAKKYQLKKLAKGD